MKEDTVPSINLDVIVSCGDKELDDYLATRGYTLTQPTQRAPDYWQLNKDGHIKILVQIEQEPLKDVATWLDAFEKGAIDEL